MAATQTNINSFFKAKKSARAGHPAKGSLKVKLMDQSIIGVGDMEGRGAGRVVNRVLVVASPLPPAPYMPCLFRFVYVIFIYFIYLFFIFFTLFWCFFVSVALFVLMLSVEHYTN